MYADDAILIKENEDTSAMVMDTFAKMCRKSSWMWLLLEVIVMEKGETDCTVRKDRGP